MRSASIRARRASGAAPLLAFAALAKTAIGLWLVSRALIPAGEAATLRIVSLAVGLGAIFAFGVGG